MTTWLPDLSKDAGPKYLAITAAIGSDLEAGKLRPGDRLPTQRELADRLDVTVGTVSRAYAEAERRGLVRGEVGRGTYVQHAEAENSVFRDHGYGNEQGLIDMSHNLPYMVTAEEGNPLLDRAMEDILRRCRRADLLGYQPPAGSVRHRTAGARWIERAGIDADPDRVLVCAGVNQGLAVALTTLMQPGDTLLVESLTYPGIKALANLLRLKLTPVAMDRDGLLPDALEAACRTRGARALYTVPTLQNPTASVMPAARRREIAAVARAHGIAILEDDCYGFLPEDAPPPISSFAPDLGLYFVSLAKSLAPGLRIAYLLAPDALTERLAAGIQTMTWMAAPLMSELAATWILDGSGEKIIKRVRKEVEARQRIAASLLEGHEFESHSHSYHVWLHLPEPWRSLEFAQQARSHGIMVNPAEAFAVGRGEAPHAVRVCLCASADRAVLEEGLEILKRVLAGAPACVTSFL